MSIHSESATSHLNQQHRISDLGHRFGLVWYNCYTLIFLNPLGHRFWSPILVSNSGLQFWSPILVSDSGLRFSVTDSVILVSDSENPVTDSENPVTDSAFLVSDSQSPIRLSWSPILVSDSDAALRTDCTLQLEHARALGGAWRKCRGYGSRG